MASERIYAKLATLRGEKLAAAKARVAKLVESSRVEPVPDAAPSPKASRRPRFNTLHSRFGKSRKVVLYH